MSKNKIFHFGNVGIGTNNPNVGNTAYPVCQVHSTSTNAYFKLTNTTTGVGSGDGVEFSLSGSDAYLTNRESANIIFRTGGSNERLRINSDGEIGINNNNPTHLLHISSTSSTSNAPALIRCDNDLSGKASYMLFNNTTDSKIAYFGLDGNGMFNINPGAALVGTNGDESIIFCTNGNSQKARITSSGIVETSSTFGIANVGGSIGGSGGLENWIGIKDSSGTYGLIMKTHSQTAAKVRNVGINETDPSNQLHIAGTTSTSAGGLLRLDATTGDNFILYDNTHDNTEWAVGNDSATRGNFDFWYYNGSSYALRLRIDSSGNTGVGDWGTSTIPQILSLKGSMYMRQGDVITWNNGDCDIGGISGYHLRFRTYTGSAMTEKFRIASDGKLTHNYNIGTNGNAGLVLNTNDATKASSILFKANSEDRARIDVQRLAGDGAQLKIQVSQMNNSNTMLDAITIAPTSSGDVTPDVTLTGNLKVASGQGIDFSATSNSSGTMQNELLDDYEEGTFTPYFSGGLVGSSYSHQKGVYTKIGRYVFGTIQIDLSTASTQQASVIDIQGLPFQAGAYVTLGGIAGIAQYGYQNGFYNSRQFSGLVIESGTSIRLYKRDDGSFLNGTDVNGGREFRMDFSYHAA